MLLADAYFCGQIHGEGDLYSPLALMGHFEKLELPWRDKLATLLDPWRLPSRAEPSKAGTGLAQLAQRFPKEHARHSDRQAIVFQYDALNDVYGLRLDAEKP